MTMIDNDTEALTLALQVLADGNAEVVAAAMVAILRCKKMENAEAIALDTMGELCNALHRAALREAHNLGG